MADEIEVYQTVKVTKGNVTHSKIFGTIKEDQAASGASELTQTVGTTEETIAYGDIGPGVVVLRNTDATNYVQWGFATGVYGGRLKAAGLPTTITLDATNQSIFVLANTAACKVTAILYQA